MLINSVQSRRIRHNNCLDHLINEAHVYRKRAILCPSTCRPFAERTLGSTTPSRPHTGSVLVAAQGWGRSGEEEQLEARPQRPSPRAEPHSEQGQEGPEQQEGQQRPVQQLPQQQRRGDAGEASTSGRGEAGPRQRSRGENSRSAPARRSQDPRPGSAKKPYSPSFWRQGPQAWFIRPEYTPATLYEEIVRRCETKTCGIDPLYLICKLATTPTEARIVLNAFAAVRASLVRRYQVRPYPDELAVAFVDMIAQADAPDVLVEALERSAELGLVLTHTRVHELLRQWGSMGELAKIEEVLGVMPLGGLPYTHETAYIVIRTAVSLGAQEKAEYYASAMAQRKVRITSAAAKLLELGRERQRQAGLQTGPAGPLPVGGAA